MCVCVTEREGETVNVRYVTSHVQTITFASVVTTGLGGNCTSVAFRIVFSCRMSC